MRYNSGEENQTIAYCLCLGKPNVMILSVHQVILVESRVFRWHGVSSIPLIQG